MNASTQVFNIPELLELILLFLPSDTIHYEISTLRAIHTCRTVSHTWHRLIQDSTPVRQKLYLPSALDATETKNWEKETAFPPAQANPWIPNLLLKQRSWGSAWPFETLYTATLYEPSQPRIWTFSLELSRAQYSRLPATGSWRAMLATSPPFTDFWYTRSIYELGSYRAPFATHVDYDSKKRKSEQKYRKHCPDGVTLGDLVDAYSEMFEKHTERVAKFVLVESVLCMPGLSAKRSLAWQY